MSWENIEDAMHKAIVRCSGLEAGRVFWSYQNINEPNLDHIRISFGGATIIGIDRIGYSYSASRPAGMEFKAEVKGLREVPFELEAFTEATSGAASARHLLELTRTRLRLPDIRYALRKVQLVPFDPGPINYLPYIPSVQFRGRATCTIRCYVPVQDCVEYAGYIARVVGTIRPTGWGPTGYGPTAGASGLLSFDSSLAP